MLTSAAVTLTLPGVGSVARGLALVLVVELARVSARLAAGPLRLVAAGALLKTGVVAVEEFLAVAGIVAAGRLVGPAASEGGLSGPVTAGAAPRCRGTPEQARPRPRSRR